MMLTSLFRHPLLKLSLVVRDSINNLMYKKSPSIARILKSWQTVIGTQTLFSLFRQQMICDIDKE